MSGSFSADWLALREPADLAARDVGLMRALGEALAGTPHPFTIVDLGCGTGSNLRGLAPHLPPRQSWRLVDHDPALLARARETLAAWADDARETGGELVLARGRLRLTVSFHLHDLAADLEGALGARPDLVTAAALFDLVSEEMIGKVAGQVAQRRAHFHTALTYDGEEEWQPPHAADAAVQAAFTRHLAGDKGLGPAAGHRAVPILEEAFRRLGYAVRTAPSPWRLGVDDDALRAALATGKADAARDTGLVGREALASWRSARIGAGSATIGHADILALPPIRSSV